MQSKNSKLVNEFIDNAIAQGKATLEGNVKLGNKAADKLYKIIERLKTDMELAESVLDIIMSNQEPNVKIWACSAALNIGHNVNRAKQILLDISNSPELGILSFNAEMTLSELEE